MLKLPAIILVVCATCAFGACLPSSDVGQLVSHHEVEHAMGACGDFDIVAANICFGGNCMAGGCGCTRINRIIDGDSTIDPAVQCGTSIYCTAPQTISNNACSGG